MHELQALPIRRTRMLAVDPPLPIADVSALVVEQARLTLEHPVAARITEVIGRAVVRIRVELGLATRTLDGAVDEGRLGRRVDLRGGWAGGGRGGLTHGVLGPRATFARLGVPQTFGTLQDRVHSRQAIVVDEAVVWIRKIALGIPDIEYRSI